MSASRRSATHRTPIRSSSGGRKSFDLCINVARADNDRLYGLVVENVNNAIMLRLQRLCKGDGLGALENLNKWFGITPNQSLRIIKLKRLINDLTVQDCTNFSSYVEEVMQAQATLAMLGKGVDEETIKTNITVQIPREYDTIVDILKLRLDEFDRRTSRLD